MKDNCSKYLGVVTSAGASDEHPMSTRSASDGRRWHSRGMQLICTLVLLFTFAIGNVWAADTVFKFFDGKNSSASVPSELNDATTGFNCHPYNLKTSVQNNERTLGETQYHKSIKMGGGAASGPKNLISFSVPENYTCEMYMVYLATSTNASIGIGTEIVKPTTSNSNSFSVWHTAVSSTNTLYAVTKTNLEEGTYYICPSGDVIQVAELKFTLTASGGGGGDATTYAIYYNCNGADSGCPDADEEATTLPNPLPDAPVKDGYTFDGWFTDDGTFEEPADAGAPLTDNVVLYAKWIENSTPDPDPMPAKRSLFSMDVTYNGSSEVSFEGSQLSELGTYGTATGGYVTLWNKDTGAGKIKINKGSGLCFNGGNAFAVLYLNEPLHQGDKFVFAEGSTSNNRQIRIGLEGTQNVYEATTTNLEYVIPENSQLIGKQVIYLARVSSATYFKTLTIETETAVPTFRTVTFDPNYTSATNITRTVADGAKVVYVPKDPENGTQEFDGWFEGSAATAFDFSTVITADKTLTAHWSASVVKHTISFNSDGGTAVETIEVEDGQVATAPTAPKKAGYEFDKWYNGEAVYDWSAAVTGDLTLTAHWNKVYVPQEANYVFENTATLGTAPNAITVTKDNKKNSISANSRIDNMWLSAMDVYLEDGTYDDGNDDFKGWKIKTASATIKFFVENDCRVTVTTGTLSSGMNIAYTNTSSEAQNATLVAKQANNYDVKGGTLVTLTTQGGNTVTLKGIAVSEIPALSDDATLKDLKVGGTSISGFSPSVTSYYVEMPYGTAKADLPLVTVTTNEEHATATIQDAKDRLEDTRATIHVVAQNGTSDKYYYVYFTVAPKLGVELIKATHTGATTASKAGYWTADATVDKNTYDNSKLGDKDYYFGLTLGGTKKFMNGDIVVIYLDPEQNASAWLQLFKDKGTNMIADVQSGVKKGANYITLAGLPEEGIDALYLYRTEAAAGNMNPYANYIAVYRQMASFIESFEIAGVDNLEIDQTNKTITASVANSFDVTALTPTVKFWANGGGSIDKTGAQNFTNPVQYTVSSAYTEDAPVTYTVTITKVVPSVEPTITTQPAGANYIEGASIAALEVVAEATAGTLSYQWQVKNGSEYEDIDGATNASYTPAISAIGSYVYRVVVTNTEESKPATSVNSDEATIVIAEDPSCKAIGYGAPRALALNTEVVIDVTAGLKHKSSKDAVEGSRKIKDVSNIDGIKLDGGAYYDIYTTEMNIGSIGVSLTSNSNGTNRKFAMIFCSTASFDANKILGIVEQTGGAGDEVQVINSPEVPLGTKLVRIMRYYKDAQDNEYGEGSSSYIYYLRACLVEPAQEVIADVTAEPASANYCPNDAVAPLAYELTMEEGASAAYQWYKGTEAIEGATAATYTPSETGVYTCKAALTKTGRIPKNLTSAEATVNFYVATAITAHADAIGDVDAEKTVSVTAEGTNLSYKWQACDENGVVTDATVLGTAASMNVTIAAEAKYYLATVTGACGVETQVVVVREWHEVAPANVTGSRTWDWSTAGMGEIATASGSVEYLMANVSSKVPNTEAFRSDMLYITANYANRGASNKFFQGWQIRFYTEVPGRVSLECRAIHEKVSITINGTVIDAERGSSMTPATTPFLVPAGWVTIVFDNISTGQYADEPARVQKIVFNAEPDHKRDVVVGNMGTVCLPNPSRAFGVKVYELAGKGEGCKVQFDQLGENEVLEAGKSYVLVMTDTKAKFFYTNTENPVTEPDNSTAMKGNLAENKIEFAPYSEEARNVVFFKDNSMWSAAETGLRVGQYRAYLQYDEVTEPATSAPAPGRRRITLDMNGANVATGMENVQGNEVQSTKVLINGQLFIIRGEKMYDATGRLVK